MMKRLAVHALVAASLLLAGGCGGEASVEEQVVAAVRELEELAEAGDRSGFMDRVAEDFLGQGGALTRDEFRAFLVLQWNRYRRLEARLLPIEVEAMGEALAQARFRALVTGGSGLLPEQGQMYRVSTTWVLDGGEWMLWRADWEAIGPDF